MKNDNELIRKYQNGNSVAFDELVRKYLDDVFGFFVKITGDAMDAEDLAQDVFLKLYKSLKKFRFESDFKTYLYRINVNAANNYLRRSKWRNWFHLESAPEQVDSTANMEQEWKKTEVWNAIAKLPKVQRMVVTMRVAQQLTHKEIANIIGISESSSKTNYHYGLNSLKQQLGDM